MDKTTWREELSWSAGFFDGEGTTGLSKGRYARMSIHQVDRRPLDRFQSAVLGVGSVIGPYPHKNGRWQPIHQWRVSGSGAQAVLAMLWPFLSEPKKEQARPVLEVMSAYFSSPTWTDDSLDGKACRRGHPAEKYRTQAGQCRMCMRVTDAKRGNRLTPAWIAKWEAEGGVLYTGW
jgi:hypothetical protein